MSQFHLQSVDWKYSRARMVVPTADTSLQHTLMECWASTQKFAQVFQAENYDREFFPQQEENFRYLNDSTIARGYVCGFRGFFKTTSLKTQLVKMVCYRETAFLMYCSKTLDYAEWQTNSIKSELISNPLIKDVFRFTKPKGYEGNNPVFSTSAWFLCDPDDERPFFFCAPKGSGQQINGALINIGGREHRVTFLAFDDGEDRTLVQNEENRQAYQRWLYDAAIPCVANGEPCHVTNRWRNKKNDPLWVPPWRIWYQDTIKHPACEMKRITTNPLWIGNIYPMADVTVDEDGVEHYTSLVPSIPSEAIALKAREASKRAEGLDGWYREYMCRAKAATGDNWHRGLFQYYEDDSICSRLPQQDKAIIVDPAKTPNPKSCYSGIIAIGMDVFNSKVYLRRAKQVKMHIHELANYVLDMCVETKTKNVFVEDTGGEESYLYIFRNEASKRGLENFIVLHEIDARKCTPVGDFGEGKAKAKIARGSLLLPLYVGKYVYHHISLENSTLETEMINFPDVVNWDIFDPAAYIAEVLRRGGRFFPNIDPEGKAQWEEADSEWAAWNELVESEQWKVVV